jgi:hypothetical protein
MDKIRVINSSLRCFVLGWVSLIPLLGLPAGFIAVLEYRAVNRLSQREWNAAENFLRAGLVLAITGILISAVIGMLLGGLILRLIVEGDISMEEMFI